MSGVLTLMDESGRLVKIENKLDDSCKDVFEGNFGVVQTERFISLIINEPFNYTVWHRDLYSDMTVNELFDAASNWKAVSSQKEQ